MRVRFDNQWLIPISALRFNARHEHVPADRAKRRGHSLAGHMPRLSEFTNQLIPQLLQIRVHADHSSQSLHLSRPPPPT